MISQKTACLLQACCQAGAIIAGASDEDVNKIGFFGIDLGMAFQIRDDILDIFGDEKEFGKKIGKDIIEKKMGNFVILSAMEQLNEHDSKYISDLLCSTNEISDEEVKTVTNLIEKTTARKIAEDMAASYIQTALNSISQIPQNEYTADLINLAYFVIDRKH